MNLTAVAFRECALAALEELDAHTEPTEIRRVSVWVDKLNRAIGTVQDDFSGDNLGEHDDDGNEDRRHAYADVYSDDPMVDGLECDG